MTIENFHFKGEHFYLSNFYKAPTMYDGVQYPTSENAYQAAKSLDPEVRKQFVDVTPGKAKK
ncbi:NADAR family protein, partial [Candidatus Pacearchaeota archaeon]|nr:NADAR family protein [Candidatus Pacearchaeota archaeon]